jgi:hypothetical protein
MRMIKKHPVLLYIGVVIAIGFIFQAVNPFQADPLDQETKVRLLGELEKIQPLPGADFAGVGDAVKAGKGAVLKEYLTDAAGAAVYKHYDAQLRSNGWQYDKAGNVEYLGTDIGRRVFHYKKGEYTASLAYQGADKGKTSFSLKVSNLPDGR